MRRGLAKACLLAGAVLAAPALAATAAGSPARALPTDSAARLAEADSGRVLALAAGTVLRVDLDANASTGAEWQRRDGFAAVLESVPCTGVARAPRRPPGEVPPVGAGTTVSYCFRAAAPGRAFLYLFYGRAWDPASTAWSHFTLDVTVTPPA